MRTVATTKPHIFKGATAWWCCMEGLEMGFGRTPQEAHGDFVRVNSA